MSEKSSAAVEELCSVNYHNFAGVVIHRKWPKNDEQFMELIHELLAILEAPACSWRVHDKLTYKIRPRKWYEFWKRPDHRHKTVWTVVHIMDAGLLVVSEMHGQMHVVKWHQLKEVEKRTG